MKVLLYTVFKDLAAADFVARILMCRSTLRLLAPRRPLRSAAIYLKIPAVYEDSNFRERSFPQD